MRECERCYHKRKSKIKESETGRDNKMEKVFKKKIEKKKRNSE